MSIFVVSKSLVVQLGMGPIASEFGCIFYVMAIAMNGSCLVYRIKCQILLHNILRKIKISAVPMNKNQILHCTRMKVKDNTIDLWSPGHESSGAEALFPHTQHS